MPARGAIRMPLGAVLRARLWTMLGAGLRTMFGARLRAVLTLLRARLGPGLGALRAGGTCRFHSLGCSLDGALLLLRRLGRPFRCALDSRGCVRRGGWLRSCLLGAFVGDLGFGFRARRALGAGRFCRRLGPRFGARLGPRFGARLGPRLDARLGSRLGAGLGPRLDAGLGSRLRTGFSARLGSRLVPRLGTGLDALGRRTRLRRTRLRRTR
ncbi:MAG TPA: hypothetical protein VFK02_30780, partial [Kofleriaceae bacterium]|nr:hypothetical protein [Kofleriaceae bacterium]